MYQYDKRLDFHALGREIKRKREAKGWTQEYLAQLVDRTPRSIMYIENRGQHPSLNTFYQLVTLLDISVDQFFYPDKQNGQSDCRKHIDVLLNSMDGKETHDYGSHSGGAEKGPWSGGSVKTRPPFFRGVSGERVSGKQGKCIDTCHFRAAKMLVGVPPNPLDFWPVWP